MAPMFTSSLDVQYTNKRLLVNDTKTNGKL